MISYIQFHEHLKEVTATITLQNTVVKMTLSTVVQLYNMVSLLYTYFYKYYSMNNVV